MITGRFRPDDASAQSRRRRHRVHRSRAHRGVAPARDRGDRHPRLEKEHGQKRADALRLPKAYGSLDELLAEPGLDAVHITTPNYLHKPMVEAAIAAGKHVVCEKPLAMNSDRGPSTCWIWPSKAGIVHATNFNFRFYPLCQEARAMVQGGKLGSIYQIYGRYVQDWLLKETDWNWRLETDLGGDMRAVADIGSHWLDLTRFITGQDIERGLRRFRDVPAGAQEAAGAARDLRRQGAAAGRVRRAGDPDRGLRRASCSASPTGRTAC